jgi:RecG-like helicase
VLLQELVLVQMAQLLERYWLQRNMQGPCSPVAAVVAAAAATLAPVLDPAETPLTTASSSIDKTAQAAAPAKNKRGRAKRPVDQATDRLAANAPQQQQQQQALLQGASIAYIIPESAASIVETAKQQLPYDLTPDQQTSLSEVLADLAKPQAMLRLLQGDVGCGKTVVAVLACLAVRQAGRPAAAAAIQLQLACWHDPLTKLMILWTNQARLCLSNSMPFVPCLTCHLIM